MKFRFGYLKLIDKSIYKKDKIILVCDSVSNNQDENIIGCYINDISNFESNLTEICGELNKRKYSGLDGQVWGADFLKDKVHIYWVFDPDNEEGKAEISRKGMLKLMKKWIEFRKKKIPENYEEYEEIIEVD